MTALRVATFNVRYDTPADGADAWPHRRERVVEAVRELDPDVIGFQEVLPDQYAYLRDRLDRYDWFGRGREGGDEGEHVPVAYRAGRFDRLEAGAFWLSETPSEPSTGWDGDCPRLATWVHLAEPADSPEPATDPAGDGGFGFLSTHLDHRGECARRRGAALIARRVATWEQPSIVVGDLNATPGTPPLERLTGAGLRVSRDVADRTAGTTGTFHGFEGEPRRRIDYVLTESAFDVDRVETATTEPPHSSDHYPVIADVRL